MGSAYGKGFTRDRIVSFHGTLNRWCGNGVGYDLEAEGEKERYQELSPHKNLNELALKLTKRWKYVCMERVLGTKVKAEGKKKDRSERV